MDRTILTLESFKIREELHQLDSSFLFVCLIHGRGDDGGLTEERHSYVGVNQPRVLSGLNVRSPDKITERTGK